MTRKEFDKISLADKKSYNKENDKKFATIIEKYQQEKLKHNHLDK